MEIVKSLDKYLELLAQLTPEQKPKWGIMTTQHMIEHLIQAVQTSNGKLVLECINDRDKLATLKRYLMSNRPLPKGFVNPYIGKRLIPLKYSSFEEAKSELEKEINDYYDFFDKKPNAKLTNVTFGELEKNEWIVFHDKYFTHHLTQFGLIGDFE